MNMRSRILSSLIVATCTLGPAFASGVVIQLTDQKRAMWDGVSLDDAGGTVYASATANFGGTNPGFMPQLDSWTATTGVASVIASIPPGAWTCRDAVSDDGAWLAFLSRGNPTGGNPDGSVELFLMRTDGSTTHQLTITPVCGGSVRSYALSGSANRVVFEADIDPLGTNPSMLPQLFVIAADGTGLRQLTTSTSSSGFSVSLSDDGTKIAFSHRGDLLGGNPDLSWEIFSVLHDGTGLTQLTFTAGTSDTSGATLPRLAGNGSRLAFWSSETIAGLNPTQTARVWTIDWAGTNLRPITSVLYPSAEPSITDDGQYVTYASYDTAAGNSDLNREIWRIKFNGTEKSRLTNTSPPTACSDPEFAGGGSRIAFRADGTVGSLNPDGGPALFAMDSTGSALTLIIDGHEDVDRAPDLTPDGTRVVFDSTRDPFASNPLHRRQLFREQTDGTGLAQVTSLTDGDVWHPRVAADGQRIVFVSDANPTGENPAHRYELFVVGADGTGLTQLTPSSGSGLGAQTTPAISGDGSKIVFQSAGNYAGGNADGSPELFGVNPDGTGLIQLTWDDSSIYKLPRVDDSGTWAVFQSSSETLPPYVYRMKTDGTGLQQITSFSSEYPDISGLGDRIAFVSRADPLGTNADGSAEVFVWDVLTSTLRQSTSFASGDIARVRLSRDGAFVTFLGTSPVFEPNPDGLYAPYRVEVMTGAVERIGALGAALVAGSSRYGDFIAADDHGVRSVYSTDFDPVDANRDGSTELFLVDMIRIGLSEVSKPSPTVVRWDADPHAFRYDVVRGEIANLAIAGSTVDLGPVTCLANDLPALDTSAYPDGTDPAPGHVFFYVERGSEGLLVGPGSYGQGTGARERIAGAGGCGP